MAIEITSPQNPRIKEVIGYVTVEAGDVGNDSLSMASGNCGEQ